MYSNEGSRLIGDDTALMGNRLTQSWLDLQCRMIPKLSQATLVLEQPPHTGQSSIFNWPANQQADNELARSIKGHMTSSGSRHDIETL